MGYLWLLSIPIFIVLILALPVRLRVEFTFDGKPETQKLAVYLYRFLVFKRIGPGNLLETLVYLYVLLTDLRDETIKLLKYLKNYCKIPRYVIHLDIGTDDAALTGMISGAAYTLIYDLSGLVYQLLDLKEKDMDVRVNPDFQKACSDLYFDGIIRLRIVHIIKVLFMVSDIYKKGKLIKIKKTKEGGVLI